MTIRGLYGWGITLDKAKNYSGTLRINLMYIERWVSKRDNQNKIPDELHTAPIPAEEVLSLPSWKDHLLSVFPIGTNFLVTDEQMQELLENIVILRFPES